MEYLLLKATQQASSLATVAQMSNSIVCLSHFTFVGSWILDSGAFDHLEGNPPLLPGLPPLKTPHSITLVDGSKALATVTGQASPLPSLSLNSVLFVSDLSMGQTTRDGYESEGLYYLQSSSSTPCAISEFPKLLHHCLGHPMSAVNIQFLSPFDVIHSNVLGLGHIPYLTFIYDYSSCLHTPQQNGVAECKHCHIVDTTQTMLINANAPLNRDKLLTQAIKCVFLGYPQLQKGCCCYCPTTHHFSVSPDVTFFEDTPFFESSTAAASPPSQEELSHPGWQ
ncbi:hypothetical protein CR513_28409, partial [Mucuna pruriens]